MLRSFVDPEHADESLEPAVAKKRQERLTLLFGPIFSATRRDFPLSLAQQLERCVHTLRLAAVLDSRSAGHFSQFLVTAYVMTVADKPHDREVARLISDAFDLRAYDAAQQKMWRHRHFKRLNRDWRFLRELVEEVDVWLRMNAPTVTVS